MDPAVLQRLLGLTGYGQDISIPYADLVVPVEFQRQLKPRNWEVFIPALFGRVIVIGVKKEKWLCDGFHRVEEGNSHGMWERENVPSIYYPNGSVEVAAAVFHHYNDDRVGVSSANKFRAACVSGDEDMRKLDADLLAIGLDGWCDGRTQEDAGVDLGAIGTVILLAEKYGTDHALYTLDTIGSIWGWTAGEDNFVGSPNSRLIKGFGEYLLPEKKVSNRRRPRRWNQKDGPMLVAYIATNFPGVEGHESFILRAQYKWAGTGGSGAATGVELQVHDCFLKAKREQKG